MTDLVATLSQRLLDRGFMLATAESCTGGMIAAAMTDRAGSSAVFDRGFVTYSNAAKMEQLGVSAAILDTHGAVSAETAAAMVEGTLSHSAAQIALSVTGIAGPSGGSAEKPVGLVYIGCGVKGGKVDTFEHRFFGDRAAIRRQSVEAALSHALDKLA